MENKLIRDYINLLKKIFQQIKDNLSDQKMAVLVSGGIDSSIIAFFVCQYFSQIHLYSLGTKNNSDFYFVDLLNYWLKKPLKKVIVSENEIKKGKKIVEKILKKNKVDDNPTQLSLALSFFLVLKEIRKSQIKYVFTGQGPDILLAGYHKYKKIPLDKINQEIKKDMPLLEIDKKRDQAIASYFGIQLVNPYLDHQFVNFSLTIPAFFKINFIEDKIYEKYLSRRVGEKLGIAKEIILRHKKALQYSTGIIKLIDR